LFLFFLKGEKKRVKKEKKLFFLSYQESVRKFAERRRRRRRRRRSRRRRTEGKGAGAGLFKRGSIE